MSVSAKYQHLTSVSYRRVTLALVAVKNNLQGKTNASVSDLLVAR
jgi:hypothetical protein